MDLSTHAVTQIDYNGFTLEFASAAAVTPDGRQLLVLGQDNTTSSVYVVNLAEKKIINKIPSNQSYTSIQQTISSDGLRTYVSQINHRNDYTPVSVLDIKEGKWIYDIQGFQSVNIFNQFVGPLTLAINRSGQIAYITDGGPGNSYIYFVDLTQEASAVPVKVNCTSEANYGDLAFNFGDSKVYVCDRANNKILVIDAKSKEVVDTVKGLTGTPSFITIKPVPYKLIGLKNAFAEFSPIKFQTGM
jgi:YVTN family beta-propeller protein